MISSNSRIKMHSKLILITLVFIGICEGSFWGDEIAEDKCEAAIKETILEDRATIVDETSNRLHATWLSQECEVRAGPEYVIRKYTFYENGTFLLLRHHYAEASCSIAMYTVAACGSIRLMSGSSVAPGATEAKYQLDRVHIVPLTREVTTKFSHRVNVSCNPQPRWRPYVPQLIYEKSSRLSSFSWEGPKYNSFFQQRHPILPSRKHRGIDCLEPLGLEFNELKLVRVQTKPSTSMAFALGSNGTPRVELHLGSLPPNVYSKKSHRSTSLQPTPMLRSDTINGCLVCGIVLRGTEMSPPLLHEVAALPALLGGSWLSSACESSEGGMWIKRQLEIYAGDMLWNGRWDYYSDSKCTSFLYAVTAAGSYIQRFGRTGNQDEREKNLETFRDTKKHTSNLYNSQGLESQQDFRESKLFFRTKRGLDEKDSIELLRDSLAEWMPAKLTNNLFESYGSKPEVNQRMLRTGDDIGEAFEDTTTEGFVFEDELESSTLPEITKSQRNTYEDESYRHLLQNAQPSMADAFAAMLRGNQRHDETTKKPEGPTIPSGTTELDLHVAESVLIAGDLAIAARCGAQILGDDREMGRLGLRVRPMSTWPRSCVPRALESPSTLGLRAKVGVNWSGQYTLLLGLRDDHIWESPLLQCGTTPSHNPTLRAHLRRSVGLRYGFYTSSGTRHRIYNWYLFILFHVVIAWGIHRVYL